MKDFNNFETSQSLADQLTGRYGALALTRAAGAAWHAERIGNREQMTMWKSVIADLRRSIVTPAKA